MKSAADAKFNSKVVPPCSTQVDYFSEVAKEKNPTWKNKIHETIAVSLLAMPLISLRQ